MPFSTDTLLALVTFAFVTTVTPGPNNFMLASSGATFGYWRTLPHIFGVCLGFPVMLFVVTLGLGEIFRTQPAVREVVTFAGLGVMLYLAFRIATQNAAKAKKGTARPLGFFSAAAFQWVNPKAWGACLAAVSLFELAGAGDRLAVFSSLYFVICLFGIGAWAVLGRSIRRFLVSPLRMRLFNLAIGGTLVLLAAGLVADGLMRSAAS